MYSHELQTCDWPRNVGCDGLEGSVSGSPASFSYSTPSRGKERGREKEKIREESRTKYSPPPPPPPPPAQPAAVVTSRGQPRNLHQSQQEIIKRKQQQQLYADAEETLPPAEEIENDRQQRVYRGQPSAIGQVQRDRDGLRHSNAISSYSGRGEKIGVISFGTQNQHYSRLPETIHHQTRQGLEKKIVDFKRFQSHTEHPLYTNIRRISFNPSAPISNNEEEFHPFTPNYKKSGNYQYIAFGKYADVPRSSTSRYVDDYTNSRNLNKRRNRYPIKYNSSPLLILQSDYSQTEAQSVPITESTADRTLQHEKKDQITQAIVSSFTESGPTFAELPNHQNKNKSTQSTTNLNEGTRDVSKFIENNESTNNHNGESLYDEELDHFEPPPEFYRSGNNYGHIKNPFANPDFDFDEFLKRFEDFMTTSEVPTSTYIPAKVNSSEISSVANNHRTTHLKMSMDSTVNNNNDKDNNMKKHHGSYILADINNYNYINLGNGSVMAIPKIQENDKFHKCNTTNNSTSLVCSQEFQKTKNFSRVPALTKPVPMNISSDYYYYYDGYEDEPESVIPDNKKSKDYLYYYDDDYYPEFDADKKAVTKTSIEIHKKPVLNVPEHTRRNQYNISTTTLPPSVLLNQLTEKNTVTHTQESSTTPPSARSTRRLPNRTISRPINIKKHGEKLRQRQTTIQPYETDAKTLHWNVPQSEEKTVAPQQASVSSVTAPTRNIYNGTQYNDNRYEPYYALYEDDVEIYRDEYPAHENSYSNNNNNNDQSSSTAYRGTSPINAVTSASIRNEIPRRGNTVYIENNISHQDIYQPSTASEYTENNKYDNQPDDQTSYKQNNRQSYRGDRNELNDVEDVTTKRSTKRTTTTTTTRKPTSTTTITTTTQRTVPSKTSYEPPSSTKPETTNQNRSVAETVLNTEPLNYQQTYDTYEPFLPSYLNIPNDVNNRNFSFVILEPYETPSPPYILDKNLSEESKYDEIETPLSSYTPDPTTSRPSYHYITKSSITTTTPPSSTTTGTTTTSTTTTGSTTSLRTTTKSDQEEGLSRSSSINNHPSLTQVITPTTYSPFRFVLKTPISKLPIIETTPISNNWKLNESSYKSDPSIYQNNNSNNLKAYKALKAVRKVLNPVSLNHELSPPIEKVLSKETESNTAETPVKLKYFVSDIRINTDKFIPTNTRFGNKKPINRKTTSSTESPSTTVLSNNSKIDFYNVKSPDVSIEAESSIEEETDSDELYSTELYSMDEKSTQRPRQDYFSKQEPKPFSKPIVTTTTKTNFLQNDSIPTRASRVNAAIKSLINLGETRGSNKNKEGLIFPSKNYSNKRTPSRGRGSVQYSGAGDQITNNEVIVTNNRGTPPTRSRPTLKPSTSIVSKVQEYVDVYRYPPRRPDPIYPQPQVDKTAAKCRKDVCLLPDCSCGGKEIPGDLPVEQVPQIVLITFDDSVNDLNKGLYQDLFEKGRTNPNGCPIAATFYVSHEWTDYSQVQNLYSDGHELASHTVSHSFGEQFAQKKWTREVAGQREILAAYGGVHLEDVRGMRAPFLSVGGNKMFKMLYDSNFTYDSSMPIYENKPPSWPYTLDYKLFHDCMIPPCPTRSYPGVWEVPMVMWQDLNGGRCSMGDACSNPPDADGVYKMLLKNFMRHYTTNRAPFGLFYHAAWFTQPHHKEGFINFIDTILAKNDVWFLTNWQAIQWVRDPTPTSRLGSFQPFQCNYSDRPKRCNNPKVCNLWHKSGVRYMRTCQPCPDIYPWTGNTGIRSSKIDNDIGD